MTQIQLGGHLIDLVTGPFTGAIGIRMFGGPTDPISDIPVILDYPHHQIHEGEMHQYTYPAAALSNGASVIIRMVANNLAATMRTPHPVLEVDATAETWVTLYETPTTSADGVLQTVYNRNRNSLIVPASTVWLNPTVSNNGTLLSSWILGAGNKTGGASRDSLEWDLASGKTYLYTITAKATGDNVCARLIYYEDTGV